MGEQEGKCKCNHQPNSIINIQLPSISIITIKLMNGHQLLNVHIPVVLGFQSMWWDIIVIAD